MTRALTDRSGYRVMVHELGSPSLRDAPIVLVHGTGGDTASNFQDLIPLLMSSHRIIGADYSSDDSRVLQLSDLIDQVVLAIESSSSGEAVNLVGYSLGAVVAAGVSAERPDLVRSLILIGGWVTTDSYRLLRSDIWSTLHREDHKLLAQFSTLTSFSSSYLARQSRSEIGALVDGYIVRPGVAAQMELNRRIDISDMVPRITAPTLVIGGRNDATIPVWHSEALADGISGAQLVILDSGHAITTERARELAELVLEFVQLRP